MKHADRKPVSNFLIKRSLQIKLLLKTLFVVLMTGVLTTVVVAWIYNAKAQAGSFYYMSNDVMQDLELTNILGIILPSVVGVQLVGFLIAVAIGLFSSRKVAVPIYKIEKWSAVLKTGNLKTKLAFREQEEMRELTLNCNAMVDFYGRAFADIASGVAAIESGSPTDPRTLEGIAVIRKTLGRIQF